jgi:hypothetical protein
MICDGFTKYFYFNFEIKIIIYSPIRQQKGHNFVYLQAGILYCIINGLISFKSKICSMTIKQTKIGD